MPKPKSTQASEHQIEENTAHAGENCANCRFIQEREGGSLFCPEENEAMGNSDWCDRWEAELNPADRTTISINGVDVTDASSPSGIDEDKAGDVLRPIVRSALKTASDEESPRKKVKEFLKYTFTREEIEEHAGNLARKFGELEHQKLQKKEVVKAIDADISRIESRISELAAWVKDGYEYRNIDCEMVYNYDRREKIVTRLDTYEIVKRITMTANELQQDLGLTR